MVFSMQESGLRLKGDAIFEVRWCWPVSAKRLNSGEMRGMSRVRKQNQGGRAGHRER